MLSVIILTKNEEDIIGSSIKSIKPIADELIVIDAGSTDSTPEIAQELGAHVVTHQFKDFSYQRNFAFKQAKGEWILYLDADEVATPQFVDEVSRIINYHNKESNINAYVLSRKTFYYGHDWGFTDHMPRLFLKDHLKTWQGVVHETPIINGSFGTIKAPILHYTHRDISSMLTKTNEWSEYEAKLRFESNHPHMNSIRFLRVIITGFIESYVKNKGYKNGTYGIIEGLYQAFSLFITYAKLWELQNKKKIT